MAKFDRIASGNPFRSIGVATNKSPEVMPANRSPFAQNLRNYSENYLQARPQMQTKYSAIGGAGKIVSVDPNGGCATDSAGNLTQNGSLVESGYSITGSSLLPFRPNASPQTWEYVFDANKARKISPTGTPQNIGIAEPQAPVDAWVQPAQYISDFTPGSAPTNGGTAGVSTAGPGGSATISYVFFITPGNEQYLAFNTPVPLSRGATVVIGTEESFVADSIPGFPAIAIEGIYYFSGTTGRCVVVPQNMGPGPGQDTSLYTQTYMQSLRRGAIIQIGAEVCQVLNSSIGPDGSICFETSTTSNHTTADTLSGLPTLKTRYTAATAGQTLSLKTPWQSAITAGVGTLSWAIGSSPFVLGGYSFQPDDYVHFGFSASALENISEIKIIFDVNNGSATYDQNAYYYTVRPSDIQAGINNTLTQLGVAQIVSQRALIDEEQSTTAENFKTKSSGQLFPGNGEISEIFCRISDLTRIGTDMTRSLANVQAVQILINATGNVTIGFDSVSIIGGGQVDTGVTGIPCQYRISPRSSVTGARGNPSPVMRYGVVPRRDTPVVELPATYADSQMDYWDIYRQGGALSNYTFVGSVPLGTTEFNDQYDDATVQGNRTLREDLYQPFPTIDYPFTGTANIVGTACVVTATSTNAQANILRYLPGNVITVGQSDYTLRFRPTLISAGHYYMELVENAGVVTGSTLNVFEPLMAQQLLPYCWGPDANGRFFGVGDTYRPGFVYTTNPSDPDSSPDNASEVCAPTEPLQGGGLIGGTSCVASVGRWWRGYPQDNGSYNWSEISVGMGLEFPYALTSDGESIYFVGKDGIYAHSGGPAVCLTRDDLDNIFPHEDEYQNSIYTYNGYQVVPPDYQAGKLFRLLAQNGYLFFDYPGIDSARHTLVCHLKTRSWMVDDYADPVTARGAITANPVPVGLALGPLQQMWCGCSSGAIDTESSVPSLSGETVSWVIATSEELVGDYRAPKLWGDISLDILPAGAGITAVPTLLGSVYGTATAIPTTSSRTNPPREVSLGGGQFALSCGLIVSGSDRGTLTELYSWQPSYIVYPEYAKDRFSDWTDCGSPGNKFFQGFILEANTSNIAKTLTIRDADTLATHAFAGPTLLSNIVQHNGRSIIAYSFAAPFRAHLVRFEADSVEWQEFNLAYVFEPTPEQALNWICQPTGWGIDGYKHMQRCLFAYSATATVTLSVTVDGRTYTFTLPSTGGVFAKNEVIFGPFLKGMIYTLSATSSAPFAVDSDSCEWLVRQWGSDNPYRRLKVIGSTQGEAAKI